MPVPVAFVVNNFDVGGLEKVVLSLLRTIDREKFEPYAVCVDGRGRLFGDVPLPERNVLVLDKSGAKKIGPFTFDPSVITKMARFFFEKGVRVVHAHNLAPLVFSGVAARLVMPRPKVVYSEHNQIYSASETHVSRFKHYVKLADRVIAVSEDLERTLARRVGITKNVSVVHNGIDGKRFTRNEEAIARIRQELGVAPDEFLVGTAVVLSKQKGITHLLGAASRVLAADAKVKFAIAGDGPLRAELEERAKSLGLGDRVKFLGYRSDVPDFVSALDTYVLSSLWEGLPLALLEGLAIGVPLVATTVGGNPEVIVPGENGYLVPPKDEGALAEALLKVKAGGPDFARAVRTASRARFDARFSESAMTSAHERIFDALLRD
jgi:glycosyltransferase involved in cell wall biosynthesis